MAETRQQQDTLEEISVVRGKDKVRLAQIIQQAEERSANEG